MVDAESWGFYGRGAELGQLESILRRKRWFFTRVSGRRRIGKTALIQQALRSVGSANVLYVQVPDSAPAGVLSAVADAMDTFSVDELRFPRPSTLLELAQTIGALARAGTVVALDEFQYFSRKSLREFNSHLQAVVDELSRDAAHVVGGLFVLGSLHTELVALLEDRDAPLYNRATDHIELGHLDVASILTIMRVHSDVTPERLLFLWNLFEGVPKFYRDCFEQGVLRTSRPELLERMFFLSSSPLRSEADNWFLSELRGRYDVILKYVARHPGCTNGDLVDHVRHVSSESPEQVGGYLKILIEKYGMIEKRLPVFSRVKAKKGRYYLRDNFLRSWLAALASPVSAINFRPVSDLVAQADQRLCDAEGFGLERLVATLYEERSRKGLGDFSLTTRIEGYWDRRDVEIDLVAIDEDTRRIRFGTCKRAASKLRASLDNCRGHIARFLNEHPSIDDTWTVERVAIAPKIDAQTRRDVEAGGFIPQDLEDLTAGL
jgi:AAA+ ATPase superfamily predicted ATPase